MGGLSAKGAVLRTASGLGVDNGTQINRFPFVTMAYLIRPIEQFHDIFRLFQAGQPSGFFFGEGLARQHFPGVIGLGGTMQGFSCLLTN
jgi:hypothetical protein